MKIFGYIRTVTDDTVANYRMESLRLFLTKKKVDKAIEDDFAEHSNAFGFNCTIETPEPLKYVVRRPNGVIHYSVKYNITEREVE